MWIEHIREFLAEKTENPDQTGWSDHPHDSCTYTTVTSFLGINLYTSFSFSGSPKQSEEDLSYEETDDSFDMDAIKAQLEEQKSYSPKAKQHGEICTQRYKKYFDASL